MSYFWIDTVNTICALLFTFLSFIDNFTVRSYKDFPKWLRTTLDYVKKIWVKISIIFALGLTLLFTNHEKYSNIETDKLAADKEFQRQLDQRDIINQRRLNESLTKTSKAASSSTAETMAKYYLKYDSTQHRVEKIVKDSLNKNPIAPEFGINTIKGNILSDTIRIEIFVNSIEGVLKNVKIACTYVVRQSRKDFNTANLEIIKTKPVLIHKTFTPIENNSTNIAQQLFNLKYKPQKPVVYVYLKGEFEDAKRKTIKFEKLSFFDFSVQRDGELNTDEYNWIYNFIKTDKSALQ